MVKTMTEVPLGAVLAGGASRRFGHDKALVPFQGTPLVLRAADVLEASCRPVVIITHLDVGLPYPTTPDRTPGLGPLGGLYTALLLARKSGSAGAFVLGCDMPLISPDLVSLIICEGLASGSGAAVPAAGPKGVEPLCGWYSVRCLESVEDRLIRRTLSLVGLLEEVEAHRVPWERLARVCAPEAVFRSANTPTELLEMERITGGSRPKGTVARHAMGDG